MTVWLLAVACAGPPIPDDPPCVGFAEPVGAGKIDDDALGELSGLAASRTQPILWTHNDSGDSPRIFALDTAGERRHTYKLVGATAADWEDIAIGPDAAIYLADTGDNSENRPDVTVWRVPEPVVPAGKSDSPDDLTGVEALTMRYPDGARDAESLMLDPRSGDLYVISKARSGESHVYRYAAPFTPGATRTLEKVGAVAFVGPTSSETLATAADISADGAWIAVRTYNTAYAWPLAAGQTVADALAGPRCRLPLASEAQGEALAWAADGSGFYTVSEGNRPMLWRVARSP
jgi:hypothetical protein